MDPWYEESGPAEIDVENTMNRSEIYLCLNKDSNTDKENSYLCQYVSKAINAPPNRTDPLKNYSNMLYFNRITYESIRSNPDWKELSNAILREEVIANKPYGSWRGFSTFVVNTLRDTIIIRIIREIWAPQILQKKFMPKWYDYIDYIYSPGGKGYIRTKEHYYNISK